MAATPTSGPGIDELDAGAGEIPRVACDHNQITVEPVGWVSRPCWVSFLNPATATSGWQLI